MDNFDLRAYLNSQKLFEAEEPSDEMKLNNLDSEIDSAFASSLNSLQGQVAEVKGQVDEAETDLNEAVASLLISILLSTPKLLEIIGGMVKKISTKFSKEKGKVTAGDGFIHAGHHLEEKYLGLLKKIIKVTGIAKKANLKSETEIDKAAKVMLYTILGAAAVSAGFASAEAIGGALVGKGVSAAVYGLAKGSLASLKGNEIVQGIKSLTSKI
tara:strand:- start:462 stop:1100 length:639 start_codon:yes stop_codon:yes gene_type:complete